MASKRYSILVENADGTVGNLLTFTVSGEHADMIANEEYAVMLREYPDKQLHLVSYPS